MADKNAHKRTNYKLRKSDHLKKVLDAHYSAVPTKLLKQFKLEADLLMELLEDYLQDRIQAPFYLDTPFRDPNDERTCNQGLLLVLKPLEKDTIQNAFQLVAGILKRHFQDQAAVKTQHFSIAVDFKSGLFIEVYPVFEIQDSPQTYSLSLVSKRSQKPLILHQLKSKSSEIFYFDNFRKTLALFTIWNGQQKAGIRSYLLELLCGRALINSKGETPDDLWLMVQVVFQYGQNHLNAMKVIDPAFPKNKNFNKYPIEKKANISGRLRNTLTNISESGSTITKYFKA